MKPNRVTMRRRQHSNPISWQIFVLTALLAVLTASDLPAHDVAAALDWPMWGGTLSRNMVNADASFPIDFEPEDDPKQNRVAKHLRWMAKLGSQTYGNPVVSRGRIYVGTNNAGRYRPNQVGDRGCVLAFDAANGKFVWQLTCQKLAAGHVNDWPEQGICSTPVVQENRMWLVTNRAELVCLDTEGFYDGENNGPVKDEPDHEKQDADIVWRLDMIDELGVFPHNLATSSPVVYGNLVFILTSNGVNESHKEVVIPRAPSFIAVDKRTGKLVWESRLPGDRILHGQWSSPAIGIVHGQAQVYLGGGDGWLYALAAETGELIWKCDLNPKDSVWRLYGRGTRNNIVSTPVFSDNSVVIAVGQDPDHGYGVGHLYRIDATQTGDVSHTMVVDRQGKPFLPGRGEPIDPEAGQVEKPNAKSAIRWHYGGENPAKKKNSTDPDFVFGRTMSTVSIHDGLVYAADLAGYVHCLDFDTGERHWTYDMLSRCWGSTMVLGDKVLIGCEGGELFVFSAGRKLKVERQINFRSAIYSTPISANGVLYVAGRSKLFAFAE